tara:strand:+ start:1456 stop:1851 length:396 start_codon:yes stop_codon:yes gene_type:complete
VALKAPSSEGVFYWYNISMPKVPTSLLNETISIQSLSGSAVDDRGLSTASYGSGTSVQARVIELGGFIETEDEGRTEVNEEFKVIVPASTSVSMADRVILNSTNYNIRNIKSVKDRFGNEFYKELRIDSGY